MRVCAARMCVTVSNGVRAAGDVRGSALVLIIIRKIVTTLSIHGRV